MAQLSAPCALAAPQSLMASHAARARAALGALAVLATTQVCMATAAAAAGRQALTFDYDWRSQPRPACAAACAGAAAGRDSPSPCNRHTAAHAVLGGCPACSKPGVSVLRRVSLRPGSNSGIRRLRGRRSAPRAHAWATPLLLRPHNSAPQHTAQTSCAWRSSALFVPCASGQSPCYLCVTPGAEG